VLAVIVKVPRLYIPPPWAGAGLGERVRAGVVVVEGAAELHQLLQLFFCHILFLPTPPHDFKPHHPA